MLETALKIFANYGWPGIVAILLIAAVVYFFKKQDKKLGKSMDDMVKNLTESMNKQNQGLIDSLQQSNKMLLENQTKMFDTLLASISNKQKEEHTEGLRQRSEFMEKINTMLRRIQNYSSASRVSLIELHNSKENLNGLPFLWYDIQQEFTAKGVTPILNKVKDIQASNLIYVIKKVNENRPHYTVLGEKELQGLETVYPTLYHHLVVELDAKIVVYVGLYGEDNVLYGFLSLEYGYEYEISQSIINRVLEDAKALVPLTQRSK